MAYENGKLQCDSAPEKFAELGDSTGWGPCSGDVTHIDRKGYAYCERHGLVRRDAGVPCRKLRPAELRKLQRGEPLKAY